MQQKQQKKNPNAMREIIACRTRTTTAAWSRSWLRLEGPARRVAVVVLLLLRLVGSLQAVLMCVWVPAVSVCVCSRCCIKHFKLSVKIKRCIAKLTNVASKRAQNALAAHLRVERMRCAALYTCL